MPKKVSMARAVSSFTAREIAYLLKKARLAFTNEKLSIKTAPKSGAFAKILIITPKKMGNAPLRNLMKRRFRALFYEEKFFQGAVDLVIYCRKGAPAIPYRELTDLLGKIVASQAKKEQSSLSPSILKL